MQHPAQYQPAQLAQEPTLAAFPTESGFVAAHSPAALSPSAQWAAILAVADQVTEQQINRLLGQV